MSSITCTRCNRPLKNPASVQNGMGPVCARKAAAEQKRGDMFRSDWHVVGSDSERRVVWIVDEDKGGRSVTNDADAVVAELAVNYPGYRIIYRDSMGNWDELCHDGVLFTGFRPARDMAPEARA